MVHAGPTTHGEQGSLASSNALKPVVAAPTQLVWRLTACPARCSGVFAILWHREGRRAARGTDVQRQDSRPQEMSAGGMPTVHALCMSCGRLAMASTKSTAVRAD